MSSVDRTAGPPAPRPWHHLPVPVVLEELARGREGLPETEVEARRAVWGTNELTLSEPTPGWRILLHQFASPLVGFLLVCAVVTAVQRHWVDTVAILAAVVLNAVIGFWQEKKAETEVRALQSLASPSTRVLRGDRPSSAFGGSLVVSGRAWSWPRGPARSSGRSTSWSREPVARRPCRR